MEKQKPRRRWFRFGLRTLLVIVTMLSVFLGLADWVYWELDKRQKEKSTVEWVYHMGGGIKLHSRNQINWWEKTKRNWLGDTVQVVRIRGSQVSDISPLLQLKNLEYLEIAPAATIELSRLSELKNFEHLALSGRQVSDEQAQELRKALPNCRIEILIENHNTNPVDTTMPRATTTNRRLIWRRLD